ncbi:hypothetical protein [Sphingosinicella sp. BN140058]|uniref:hypothetical protein n=1 Tax=Sphingosinicella sp. BN140058 TaxID=1892855 RepID=UPI001010CF4F|nr:hypothetical protein [Sphingosinicella sp. BN140058]QAY78844.1 hypothetical protein ETR14_21620 [Sphingosinicella sp. BN140058]
MREVRGLTAVAGLFAVIVTVATIALYFAHAGAPPSGNVLARTFLALLSFAAIIVFMAGFHHLLSTVTAEATFALSLSRNAGLLFVAVGLFALCNEAGVVFADPSGTVDPTIDGPLAAANMLAHGSVKRLLTALYLVSVSHAVLQSRAFPSWLGWLGLAIGAVNLGFLPSLFFGTDPTHFYSAHGWGNSALAGSLIIWWILAASVCVLRRSTDVPQSESGRTKHPQSSQAG